MLRKIVSKITKSANVNKTEVSFFDLPLKEKKDIIKKAAELSAQDQKDLLKKYDRKFGELQTNTCK